MTPHIRLVLLCAKRTWQLIRIPQQSPAIVRVLLGVLLFVAATGVFYTRAHVPTHVYAATSSTLNFQARLSNASGGIVTDGNYSVQFNLYNVVSGGTAEWTETQGTVAVKSGYLSVYLGSVSSFPSTIDWSQEHWLTMNVNGDGEMSPRLKLTAVPFAFQAQNALGVSSFATSTASTNSGNVTIQSGNATGATSNSGNLTVDTGTATGTTGTISIATANASALTLGRTGLQTTIGGTALIQGGGLTVGTAAQAGTVTLTNGAGGSSAITANTGGMVLTSGGDISLGASDTTGTLLVLDTKTNSGDPTGVNGAMYYNSNDGKFRCYQNGQWQDCINGANNNSTASFVSGLANVGANVTGTAVETLVFTSATAVSNTAGITGFTAPAAGSFRTCLIKNNAAITAGTLNLRWRVNGVSTGAAACVMNNTTNRQSATALDPGVVTFNAGDTIGIAFDTVGMAPTTNDFTVYWTVEYNASNAATVLGTLQSAYNNSSSPELILDNTRGALTVRDNATPITGNLLEIQNNGGGVTYFSVATTGITSSNALTVQSGGASISGGINNNTGNITNTGSITGVGANITGTGALTLASGGAGALTLDSASNTLVIAANDTGAQRTAAGAYNFDLNDAANTTFNLTNTGAGLAGLDVEGGITAGNGNAFSVNSDGDITSAFTVLNGTSTANGAGAASTTLILANAANFDVGNYVQVNSANCGGAGVNPCYAKITAKAVNTLTITPALTWANGSTVNEYHIPEIGGIDTSQTLANRYGRGYFIAGIAAGNGTTYYNEDSISSSLSTFDLLNTGVTTLNIGGAATDISIGTGATTVNVAGALNVGGTTIINASGALTNISSVSGPGALSITSGGTGDLSLDSASNKLVIAANDTTLQRTAAGAYTVDLNDAATTTLTLTNSGTGAADLNLAEGGLQINGTTVITNGRVLQNVTANTSILTSGTLGNVRGGTGLDTSAASNGQLLIGNGTGFSLGSLSNSGGLTVTPGAGTLGLAVNYGSAANTAVQGNVTLTCPSGSGNLSGGGTVITLGTGGTCGALSIVNNPSFTASVSSPSFTGTGAVSVSSGGTGALTLDSASGTLIIAGTDTTMQRTAAGAYTIDLNDAAATTLTLNNSGAGAASLNLSDGNLQIAGTQVLSNTRALANLTGVSSSGTVTFSVLSAGGLVKSTGGNLSLATAGTDYENPLAFTNGLTRTTNTISLGGNLTGATNIGLSGNVFTISGSGGSLITALAAGGMSISANSTAAFVVQSTGGTSYLSVNTTGNLVQVGSVTTDATAILSVLDYYNQAADPTGTNGGQYYNSVNNKFRCYENSVWKDCMPTTAKVTADVSNNSNTTVSDATGATLPVAANRDYNFDFTVLFQSTQSVNTGIALGVSGPAGLTSLSYTCNTPLSADGTAALYTGSGTASNDLVISTSVAATNTTYVARCVGTLRNGATAGNLQLRFRSEVNNSNVTIKIGTTARSEQLP